MAMIVPTFPRRPIIGCSWIVLSAIGTGFLSFGLWVHHIDPHLLIADNPLGLTPLADQHVGAVIMLGVGGAAYLTGGIAPPI